MLLIVVGVLTAVLLVIAALLTLGGSFSPIWFARGLLLAGLVTIAVELLILPRALRVEHVRGPLATWRRQDRTQACSFIVLGALVGFALLFCGGIMEWWLEFR
jgi:hypothetical protein